MDCTQVESQAARRSVDQRCRQEPIVDALGAGSRGLQPGLDQRLEALQPRQSHGGNEVHPPPSQIPVRFEWTRNSKKSSGRRQTVEAQARLRASMSLNASVTSVDRHTGLEASGSNASPPRQSHMATTSASAQSLGVEDAAPPRLSSGDAVRTSSRPASFISGNGHRSPRRSVDTSNAGSVAHHGEDDSGDESIRRTARRRGTATWFSGPRHVFRLARCRPRRTIRSWSVS